MQTSAGNGQTSTGHGDLFAYVGCRTTRERQGVGQGISVYRIEGQTGRWTLLQLLKGLINPSYLAFDRTRRFLYAVHADLSEASAYAIDQSSGQLAFLNAQDCGGPNPVHLTVDKSNRHVVTANYANGTVGVLPIKADGSLGARSDLATLTGELGPHKIQQKGFYPHHIPDDASGRFFIVPDKGGDQVCVFSLDADAGMIALVSTVQARSGAAPRHIALHPSMPFAYLANELDSTIATYAWDATAGTLRPLQILPSVPETYTGNNTTAEIEVSPSGGHVYISNRGHDSIGIFAADPKSGLLAAAGWQSTGRQPRFFALAPGGKRLYCANEMGNSITSFTVDAATGALKPTGQPIETGTPTCIIFKAA